MRPRGVLARPPDSRGRRSPRRERRILRVILTLCMLVNPLVLAPVGAMASTPPAISAGYSHTVGLGSDGAVLAVGDNSDGQLGVLGWTDIVAISAGYQHTVGLRADGTCVAVGYNYSGQCNVSGWTDIVAIAGGGNHTVALRSDGTCVAVGQNSYGQLNVSGWTDIVAVAAGMGHTIGVKADGTCLAVGAGWDGQLDVSGWTDIVAVSGGYGHTVGLRSDGSVVAAGWNAYNQCDVSGWTDIVGLVAGYEHTVGLRSDGTCVSVGRNRLGECEVSGWTDVVAVSAGCYTSVALRSDGTCVGAGSNSSGQLDVSGWNLGATSTEPPAPGSSTSISVTADVPAPPPSLTFTVSPGVPPYNGAVTESSISFGTLLPDDPTAGSHYLSVTTNAASGYTVTAAEAAPLTSGTDAIPNVMGDDGTITHSTAGPWTSSTTYGFGYTLENENGSDAVFTFASGYKAFADFSAGEVPQAVMSAAGPVTGSLVELVYRVNIAPTQPQGAYSTTVTYVATGTF